MRYPTDNFKALGSQSIDRFRGVEIVKYSVGRAWIMSGLTWLYKKKENEHVCEYVKVFLDGLTTRD